MNRIVRVVVISTLAVAALAATNYFRVSTHASVASKYRDMDAWAYYKYGVFPDEIVFDLWGVEPQASAASVIGGFLDFAGELKDRDFSYVYFASRGRLKFRLSGTDFKQMGIEHDYQNPVYVVRTFPEKLENLDGRPAFSTWTGGMLGVLNEQMDDVNEFSRQWWLDDFLASYR